MKIENLSTHCATENKKWNRSYKIVINNNYYDFILMLSRLIVLI